MMGNTGSSIKPAASSQPCGPAEELLSAVYDELRKLAAWKLAREAPGQTLQPTALVHEAWLRLSGSGGREWASRAQFFAAAAEAMRRILVENARRKSRLKRGGNWERVDVEELDLAVISPDEKVVMIDEALERLQQEQPDKAQVVLLKFFAGMSNAEVATQMGVTERTVERHWAYAKAWLFRTIQLWTKPANRRNSFLTPRGG